MCAQGISMDKIIKILDYNAVIPQTPVPDLYNKSPYQPP